jgi:hypothetical protein
MQIVYSIELSGVKGDGTEFMFCSKLLKPKLV